LKIEVSEKNVILPETKELDENDELEFETSDTIPIETKGLAENDESERKAIENEAISLISKDLNVKDELEININVEDIPIPTDTKELTENDELESKMSEDSLESPIKTDNTQEFQFNLTVFNDETKKLDDIFLDDNEELLNSNNDMNFNDEFNQLDLVSEEINEPIEKYQVSKCQKLLVL
jgi:hypothetical protein